MEENKTLSADAFTPATGDHAEEESRQYVNRSYWQDVFATFRANRAAMLAAVFILIIILAAIVAPMLSHYSYREVEAAYSNLPPRIPGLEKLGIFNGCTKGVNMYAQKNCLDQYHYFGTDNLGRDIWTRVWQGTRISLFIALVAVLIDLFIGVLYGLVSGYYGGRTDIIMQRITEVLSSLPTIVIITLMLVVMKPGLKNIIIAMLITGWINMSRIVRAQVLKLKDQEFVLAARTLGVRPGRILLYEILPNSLGQIIITFMFSIPNAIFTEAFLAFIGLGVQAPQASLGTMINDGYNAALTYPYQVVAPVVVLALLMLSFNLCADGLREAIDPQMKAM